MTPMYPDGRLKRPIKKDAYLWSMEVQGDDLHLIAHPLEYESRGSKVGRKVMGFSEESRRRLIRLISQINWNEYTKGCFITVTIPDVCWPMLRQARTNARHRLFRDIEKHLGYEFPAIWRIEWKPRQSGRWVNHLLPHWHIIAPSIAWLGKETLRELWRRILGQPEGEPLATDVQELTDNGHAQVYICKYAAKMTNHHTLDSVVQVNTGGRHWGIHRRKMLAVHPKETYNDLPPDSVEGLRRIAHEVLEHYDPRYDAGFTLHGEAAKRTRQQVIEILVDSGTQPE